MDVNVCRWWNCCPLLSKLSFHNRVHVHIGFCLARKHHIHKYQHISTTSIVPLSKRCPCVNKYTKSIYMYNSQWNSNIKNQMSDKLLHVHCSQHRLLPPPSLQNKSKHTRKMYISVTLPLFEQHV